MSLPGAWPQVLEFFDTPPVIEPSPGQLSSGRRWPTWTLHAAVGDTELMWCWSVRRARHKQHPPLGLHWPGVDLQARTIEVKQSLEELRGHLRLKGHWRKRKVAKEDPLVAPSYPPSP